MPASISQSVSHEGGCAKTAEWINILFCVEIPGDPRNIVLDRVPSPTVRGSGFSVVFFKLLSAVFFILEALI